MLGLNFSWYQLININGTQLDVIRKLPEYHVEIENEMTIHCSACLPLTMMRRELLNKTRGFDSNLKSAVDYDLFLQLLPITSF